MFRKNYEKVRGKVMRQKKLAAILMAACVVAAVGCGKKEISNQYVQVSQYKGVEAEKVTAEKVKDEDVTTYIESVRAQNRAEVTDRALQKGDLAQFEYTGKLGDKVFDSGVLTLGSGETYVDGFEEGIYGHKIDETFDLPIKFPEGYGGSENPELSGADVVFTIKIKAIKDGNLPELNDEFVKKVSKKSKTVDEYKKEVKDIIQKSNDTTAKTALEDNAWKVVIKNTKVKEYPKDRLKDLKAKMEEQLQSMMEYYGVTKEDYLAQAGLTEETYKENLNKSAKEYLKQLLAVELISKEEGLALSDKDYDKLMKDYAERYGYESVDAMNKMVGEAQVKETIHIDHVKEFVAKNCKQVEPKKEDSKKDDSKKDDTKKEDSKKEEK